MYTRRFWDVVANSHLSKVEEASMLYGAFGIRVLVSVGVMPSTRFELGASTTRRAVASLTWCLDW
jgi:hypothetical protein